MTNVPAEITPAVDGPPPPDGPVQWVRKNLFSSFLNGFITILSSIVIGWVALAVLGWIFGEDWTVVRQNLRLFMVGQFPQNELWRPWVSGFFLVAALGVGSSMVAYRGYETTIAKGLVAEKPTWREFVARFWPLLGVVLLFASFARPVFDDAVDLEGAALEVERTGLVALLPSFFQPFGVYIGLLVAALIFVAAREGTWFAGRWLRASGLTLAAGLTVGSIMALAGPSELAGAALGLLLAVWLFGFISRREILYGWKRMLLQTGLGVASIVILAAVVGSFQGDVCGAEFTRGCVRLDRASDSLSWWQYGFGWENWGGLHINLFVTVVGIALGAPFGILLALGRRSKLPVISSASMVYIEFIRGVPLISLLFFSSVMLRFFFPTGQVIPADLTLALIVITGFTAAYIAEIVRGGLQAVSKGQVEASQASGMSAVATQRFIVLPQALRAVIPSMVSQFISLFKDTSLLSIIAINELLAIGGVVNNQPAWIGQERSLLTYSFIGIGFWAFAYVMSTESRRLERKLGVGER